MNQFIDSWYVEHISKTIWFKQSMSAFARVVVLGSLALLAACSGTKYAYQKEAFDTKGPFDRHFNAPKAVVYQAMKRVALRQGFAVEKDAEASNALVVSKQYQQDNLNTLLTISGIVTGAGNTSDAWIAAQEVTLKSHETKQTTSVGFLSLSIPIPTGTTATLTKERGETVVDPVFYERMFASIEREVPNVRAQLESQKLEDDARLRSEIEQKLRIEMEIKARLEAERVAKLEAEQQAKLQKQAADAAAANAAPAPASVPAVVPVSSPAAPAAAPVSGS